MGLSNKLAIPQGVGVAAKILDSGQVQSDTPSPFSSLVPNVR